MSTASPHPEPAPKSSSCWPFAMNIGEDHAAAILKCAFVSLVVMSWQTVCTHSCSDFVLLEQLVSLSKGPYVSFKASCPDDLFSCLPADLWQRYVQGCGPGVIGRQKPPQFARDTITSISSSTLEGLLMYASIRHPCNDTIAMTSKLHKFLSNVVLSEHYHASHKGKTSLKPFVFT